MDVRARRDRPTLLYRTSNARLTYRVKTFLRSSRFGNTLVVLLLASRSVLTGPLLSYGFSVSAILCPANCRPISRCHQTLKQTIDFFRRFLMPACFSGARYKSSNTSAQTWVNIVPLPERLIQETRSAPRDAGFHLDPGWKSAPERLHHPLVAKTCVRGVLNW